MNKEDFFIKQISNSKYNGDDGAFINGYVYSMDAFFENVHFKKEWIDKKIISLKQIAYKSMLVNISDAIAMNAKPKYALISIAIPKSYTNENLKELSSGFKKAARDFNFEIIGGDTIENSKLDISITIVSKTKNPIFRNGVKEGDYLCYTGKLGESKRDLETLLSGKNFFRIHRSYIVNVDKIKSMKSVEQSKLQIYFDGIAEVITSSKEGAKEFREYLERRSL